MSQSEKASSSETKGEKMKQKQIQEDIYTYGS